MGKTVSLKLHVTLSRMAHIIYNYVGGHCFSGGESVWCTEFFWLVNWTSIYWALCILQYIVVLSLPDIKNAFFVKRVLG